MYCSILPDYEQDSFIKVNLDLEFRKSGQHKTDPNPMLIYQNQESFLEQIAKGKGGLYTYGGYLEDRSSLWRTFEPSKKMIHLGLDINNLCEGARVSVPISSKVVHVYRDNFEVNGWGGRLIFEMSERFNGCKYLMYGHLLHETLPEVGQTFEPSETVCHIGGHKENGGWFEHLHVQLITDFMFLKYQDNLHELDGYALDQDLDVLESLSADPERLVFFC